MRIVSNPHNTRKRECALVERLEKVRENHDRENPSVDEFLESGILLWRDLNRNIADIFRNFLVDTVVIHVIAFHVLHLNGREDFLRVGTNLFVTAASMVDFWGG